MHREILVAATFGFGLCLGCNSSTSVPTDSSTGRAGGQATVVGPSSAAAGRVSPVVTPPSVVAGASSTLPPTATAMAGAGASGTASPGASAGSGAAGSAAGAAAAGPAAGSGGRGMATAGSASDAGSGGAKAPTGGSTITGTLGALGPAQPVMAGWATTNGLETLVYLSSSPLTCAQMMTRGVKWLSTLPAKTQVIEIVVGNPSAVKSYAIGSSAAFGGGEVNYAEGSKSSSTEVTGKAGTIMFTTATAKGVQEGMINVTAPFMVSGTFHAEWCEGGTEY